MTRDEIRQYFERVAPVWDPWHRRNWFYHDQMHKLVQGRVPPGSTVLEFGAGTGELLNSLRPQRGVGLNLAKGLTDLARQKFPSLEFHTVSPDQVLPLPGFRPEYIVMTNLLDYAYDIWDLLENLKSLVGDETLLIITTNNPLWAPMLRLGSRLGFRIPDSVRNFITNKDIRSVLELQGFDVVEERLALPVPVKIPWLGDFLNALLPELPLFRYASSIQYLAARPRIKRPPLSVSVIIPCHNEEKNIAECVRRVPSFGRETEILVVDDGSTDGTRKQVEALMPGDPRVRLISFERNQGKALAVRAGGEAARGEVLMILDADRAVPPEELPKFLKPLQEGSADFVNGTRLVYPMEGRAMKFANFLGNKAFCYLTSWALGQRVSDTLCGTKAFFKRDFIRMVLGGRERWGDFDLLFGAARLGLRILEIPVHYQERTSGKSKMRALSRDGWLFLRATWHGWRMLRFPERFPWSVKSPLPAFQSVEPVSDAA